jgi:drug/metabolite transporter (DMT)-like permease
MLTGLALVWGSSFILMKLGLEAFPPGQVGAFRIGLAGVLMLPWALRGLRTVPRSRWKYLLLVGASGNLIPAFLFAWAQTGLASSLTGVLNALTPLFTFLLGLLLFKVSLLPRQVAGLVMGFVGSLAIALVGSGGELGTLNAHALLVVAATLSYGISANTIKSALPDVRPLTLAAMALASVSPVAVGYLLFSDFPSRALVPAHATALAGVAALGIVGTGVALIVFNKLIQMTSAIYATSVTYLIPLVAVAWGLADRETLHQGHYAGMALILAGVYLVNTAKPASAVVLEEAPERATAVPPSAPNS